MSPDINIANWVVASALLVALILYRHWRAGFGVGLVLTYIFSFAVLHWLVPALQLLPWVGTESAGYTPEGLRQSTIALAGFLIGLELSRWLTGKKPSEWVLEDPVSAAAASRMVTIYLAAGIVLYMLVPIAGRLPSIAALVSTGPTLAAVGVSLKCWHACASGHRGRMWLWLALTITFPLVTVLGQGFLGYGFLAVLIVLAFVASLHRPSVLTVVAGVLLFYAGLSIYVTYMRDRGYIREVVWGGETMDRRFAQIQNTFQEAEWFDIRNQNHINRVDERLNQDYLIGAAATYIGQGRAKFAGGQTFLDAAIAVIPRALWPDKPAVAGSGNLVSNYTGIRFVYGTSVGVGQVLEMYINFGTAGVALGFVFMGVLVAFVDRRAARHLSLGDIRSFALWYLPGLSLLQIGGSFGELTTTAGASMIMVLIIGTLGAGARRSAALPPRRPLVSDPGSVAP